MSLQAGQIVKNLVPTEPVTINKVQPLGSSVSISFTGVNTKLANTKVISSNEFEALEILTDEGTFNFKGDPLKFALFAEAERINPAYQFDPLFAVNCGIVVMHCKSTPELHRIQNPAKALKFERKTKGVQYFPPMQEWMQKVNALM